MANSFQRLTFAFSSLSPILLVFSIIYFGKGGGTLHIFYVDLFSPFFCFSWAEYASYAFLKRKFSQ